MPDDMHASEFERRVSLMRSSVLRGVLRHGPSVAGHAARVTLWGIVHFAFVLTQQVAELLSPLLLVVGAGWYLLPRAVALIQTNDGQMRDVLNGLVQRVPTELTVADHVLTPTGLMLDGVLLMVVAAGLSTLTAVLANELYRDR
jgi:hypothetical protein